MVDEIVVTGRRRSPWESAPRLPQWMLDRGLNIPVNIDPRAPPPTWLSRQQTPPPPEEPPPEEPPPAEIPGELAGLAAVAVPIEEIVVTARRPPPKLRLIRGTRPWPGLLRPAGAGAGFTVGALFATFAGIAGLDLYRQRLEQEEWQAADKAERDAELEELARRMSAQVTVFGRRPVSEYFYPFRRFPEFEEPVIMPDATPAPSRLPEFAPPAEVPEIAPPLPEFAPLNPTLPEFPPLRLPGRLPRRLPGRQPGDNPLLNPARDPSFRPIRDPFRDPFRQPRRQPQRDPRPDRSTQPQRFSSVGGLTGVGAISLPSQFIQPKAQQARKKCPPCKRKKEKDKKREKCFKKLVFERSFKKWDREVKWTQIDCETGREL